MRADEKQEMFWMVWNPGTGYTMHRHDNRGQAIDEAKRMANLHKGEEFHVLASVGRAVVVEPVMWFEYPNIPF